ncbi:NAD(P)-binding protein [Eremomyces bilateralis CBS 781.70]|uniref:NAD(P)-binding protein n=1 Tax=Eremomyces bilateralis CBS 781.70 TaxID=1392243 RepID=A0A6G1G9X7_9PEZI|nr:NAD(P)-binding protein [Eremomyces bilateralis CBS 781.70]KAF1814746.1 NAD(P)-binding protein [Eremomyces bilateralis CBS 781.70]
MASNDPPKLNNEDFTLQNVFNVRGKIALVTGGGSGIGLMVTQALAVNGAKVYIVGRTEEKLERVAEIYGKNISGQIIPFNADVSKKEAIAAMAKELASREKRLDILVNNAGIDGATFQTEATSAEEMKKNLFDHDSATVDDWMSVYQTNVPPLYFTTFALLPLLQNASQMEHGYSATVVNITSISGIVKTAQHHFSYNASKAAAVHLTRMIANEVARNGLKIRVNAIAPGVFPSEMTAGSSGENQKSAIPKEKYESKVPAARPGNDRDMAGAVLFAACNQYLNGQNIVVDGGYTLASGL